MQVERNKVEKIVILTGGYMWVDAPSFPNVFILSPNIDWMQKEER